MRASTEIDMRAGERILKSDHKMKIIRRQFNYGKLIVEELIFIGWDPGERRRNKLVWCMVPFEKTTVEGVPNPCAHSDFSRELTDEWAARSLVREAFDKHHKINLPEADWQTILMELDRTGLGPEELEKDRRYLEEKGIKT